MLGSMLQMSVVCEHADTKRLATLRWLTSGLALDCSDRMEEFFFLSLLVLCFSLLLQWVSSLDSGVLICHVEAALVLQLVEVALTSRVSPVERVAATLAKVPG